MTLEDIVCKMEYHKAQKLYNAHFLKLATKEREKDRYGLKMRLHEKAYWVLHQLLWGNSKKTTNALFN